jgi:predicted DCC family thiol-disulfide oxidoreductase YuxK
MAGKPSAVVVVDGVCDVCMSLQRAVGMRVEQRRAYAASLRGFGARETVAPIDVLPTSVLAVHDDAALVHRITARVAERDARECASVCVVLIDVVQFTKLHSTCRACCTRHCNTTQLLGCVSDCVAVVVLMTIYAR